MWCGLEDHGLWEVKASKKRTLYSQADRKGEGGSAPKALTVSKCEKA